MMRQFSLLCGLILSLSLNGQLNVNDLDKKINQHLDQSFIEYRAFVSIPNDALAVNSFDENIKWVTAAFTERGFDVQRITTGGLDLVFAEMSLDPELETVLFYMHIDGQPVDPSKWDQENPYTPTLKRLNEDGEWITLDSDLLNKDAEDDWRVFARSSSDAKGPINMFLTAIDILFESGEKPKYNVKVIMDTEEEIGSPNLAAAVIENKELLSADGLIILDGPMHPVNKPTIVFGARGIATMRLTTFGPKVPLHSGHYGNYAPNPAFRLVKLLASMKDDDEKVTIPGFYAGIKLDNNTLNALAAVPDDEKQIMNMIGIGETDKVGHSLQEALQYPSLNIRGMQSAWVGAKVRTIVPHTAVANIDIRTVVETDGDHLIGLVKKHIEDQGYYIISGREPTDEERMKYGKIISVDGKSAYKAFRTDLDHPFGIWLGNALEKVHHEQPIKLRTSGGSVPISPFVNTLNIPAISLPLVNGDNNQHSPNENLKISNYRVGIKSCVGVLSSSFSGVR